MNIVSTTDLSDYTANINISESITLMERFGLYVIIKVTYKPGIFGTRKVKTIYKGSNYRRAVNNYIANGGYMMRRSFDNGSA